MTDLAVLSETQRQGEATRALLGAPLRLRKVWTGPERNLASLPVQQWNLFKLRDPSTPVTGLENIAHNGTVYAAATPGGVMYSSTDLVTWTQRNLQPSSTNYRAINIGAVWFIRTWDPSNGQHLRRSADLVTSTYVTACANAAPVSVVGNLLYLMGSGNTSFQTIDAAGAVSNRNSSTSVAWTRALSNGAVTLLADVGVTNIDVSTNGITGWTFSAGLSAAIARLPAGTRHIFVVGNKFVIVSFSQTALYTLTSEDGHAWAIAAKVNMPYGSGRTFAAVNADSISVAGWHLINVKLAITVAGATSYEGVIMGTPDGIRWRIFGPYHLSAGDFFQSGLYRRVGTDSVLFNATSGGVAMETDIDNAMETYYAV